MIPPALPSCQCARFGILRIWSSTLCNTTSSVSSVGPIVDDSTGLRVALMLVLPYPTTHRRPSSPSALYNDFSIRSLARHSYLSNHSSLPMHSLSSLRSMKSGNPASSLPPITWCWQGSLYQMPRLVVDTQPGHLTQLPIHPIDVDTVNRIR
jgi:hypothetical protein